MSRYIIFIIVSLFFFGNTFGQPDEKETAKLFQTDDKLPKQQDFSAIDNYVLGLKNRKKMSEEELVALITKQSQTKTEKARAIFIWIADNIAYDTSYKITSKEDALKQGKGVCQAYSGIFQSFCETAGLEVITISGESKQYYYKQPSDLDKGGHAWNAVKTENDRWMLVDATWGAGHVMNKVFTHQLTTYWFDPVPEIYIFSHFPKEENQQFLNKPVGRDDFLAMPPPYPNVCLWGFNPHALLAYFLKNKKASFPEMYSLEVTWKINTMPVCYELKKGKSYKFEFILPENEDVAIIFNNKDWVRFEKDGDKYTAVFTPEKKGTAVVAVKQNTGKFGGVFKYEVID